MIMQAGTRPCETARLLPTRAGRTVPAQSLGPWWNTCPRIRLNPWRPGAAVRICDGEANARDGETRNDWTSKDSGSLLHGATQTGEHCTKQLYSPWPRSRCYQMTVEASTGRYPSEPMWLALALVDVSTLSRAVLEWDNSTCSLSIARNLQCGKKNSEVTIHQKSNGVESLKSRPPLWDSRLSFTQ